MTFDEEKLMHFSATDIKPSALAKSMLTLLVMLLMAEYIISSPD
jgi:hypothetical protein